MQLKYIFVTFLVFSTSLFSQENINKNKFKQLKQELATPTGYRTAGGAPGHEYYQQKADYQMSVTLDDSKQRVDGMAIIDYINNSPDQLEYLWLQLDQNMRSKDSDTKKIRTGSISSKTSFGQLKSMIENEMPSYDGGFKIEYVKDQKDNPVNYFINKTMMRVNLDKPLKSGEKYTLKIKWWYNINDRDKVGGRSGLEYFEKEDNYIYTIAQFYPRMAVYNEIEGWQNKQFLGRGEFALVFGDYKVNITVPEDHIVGSTGILSNADQILTEEQKSRFNKAKSEYKQPVFVVNQEEATENEKEKSTATKTWTFEAENVRDFAFASSRKFIWDAMTVKQEDGTEVLAMSYYPKEGNPLWEQYSTKAVAHTLRSYSKYTFPYPYPVAISVHTKAIGMEYPMICFNGGRPEDDGTYSDRTKYGMIGVIIHEVGHNYFPMIVNSDERQWTWMDEGLNTFLQYLAEQEFERDYPSRRGPAYKMVGYMKGDKKGQMPIMVNSESILQFGNNAYGKPATALNILRETVMGRELFDYSFKTYARRWMFKHPTPEDFFRTMEDASAVDLDWFWRGWFYTTDHVDISIDGVKYFKINTKDPEITKKEAQDNFNKEENAFISNQRNKADIKRTYKEEDKSLNDFYSTYNRFEVTQSEEQAYENFISSLSEEDYELLKLNYHFYQIDFSNVGGLVMPVILQFNFEDGTNEVIRIPAEIWRQNNEKVSKVFVKEKKISKITLDPFLETADVDVSNNYYPKQEVASKFELFKYQGPKAFGRGLQNPMPKPKVEDSEEEKTEEDKEEK